jgi:GTP-binding protein HflX
MKQEIYGKTLGLKQSEIEHLERLAERRIPRDQYVGFDLAQELCALSARFNRRIGLYVNRAGEVEKVILGTATHLEVPEPKLTRRASGRLSGIRLIETVLDEVRGQTDHAINRNDLADLLHFRLDALVELRAQGNGSCRIVRIAHLSPPNEGDTYRESQDIKIDNLPREFGRDMSELEHEFATRVPRVRDTKGKTRALVVALLDQRGQGADDAIAEIAELTRSADAAVVERLPIKLRRIDPSTYLTQGKVEEVELHAVRCDADVIVFDRELSPVQARNLERDLRFKIIDRTALILDIFAQRAQSTDGKLQVELARLKYDMPRSSLERGTMSRIGGGGGGGGGLGATRGGGETAAAVGKRRARDRIADLERRIEQLGKRRHEQRKQRERTGAKVVSLVGYTNAGKSTLFNALTGSSVIAEDKLFATLDPTARRMFIEDRSDEVVLTDTVGFIRDLPKDLVNAFRATLEGLSEADLLVHVADAANPAVLEQLEAVERTLSDLGLLDKPLLLLFNKRDRVDPDDFAPIAARHGGKLVSARDPDDLRQIRGWICDALDHPDTFQRPAAASEAG